MGAATGQARNGAPDAPHSREIFFTVWALVKITSRPRSAGEGQIVTTPFSCNGEIRAGLAPFRTVRRNSPASHAELREDMSKFVAKRAIDLGTSMFRQLRI
jgi:hypothetical protein